MSDSDQEKKPAVPSWQSEAKSQPAKDMPVKEKEKESRQTVITQAQKFLEEDEVRDASTDKKIAFLEKKGLESGEIQKLLGISRNIEASSVSESLEPSQQPQPSQPSPQPPYSSPPPQPPSNSLQPLPPSQPPIITYPEFLTTASHPTPLITKPRLLKTLYLFSSITAILYGTHTYLLTPMLASLTTARLSLAVTSKTNLDKLNTQLESVVSEIPTSGKYKDSEEDSESDEDPTELFHRDIGIQTSPPTSRPSSPSPTASATTTQVSRLASLKSSIQDLVHDSNSEGQDSFVLEGTMDMLKEYLDGLAYVTPAYSYGVGGYGGGSGKKEEDDEIARVKLGIRGVKGVLLSARSFPGGVRVGGR